MRRFLYSLCVSVLASTNVLASESAQSVQQVETLARSFCGQAAPWQGKMEECVGAQLAAATATALYMTQNPGIPATKMEACMIEVAEANAGLIDFVSALSCVKQ